MKSDLTKPLVSIFTLTYNHAAYIRQCLDGFLMQKTFFYFEVIINDDASTDGTTEILREYEKQYPEIIKPIYHEENQYSKGFRGFWQRFCLPHAKGEYIAICEGDDYWTDSLKLQKQVDFLETHIDYTMCFHNAMEHWENSNKKDCIFSQIENKDYTGLEIYKNWIIPTASVVFRKSVYNSYLYRQTGHNNNFIFGDIILFLTCAELGKLRGFQDIMSVYRRHDGGATAIKSYDRARKQGIHYLEIYKLFGQKYKKQSLFFFTKIYTHSFLKSIIDSNSKIRFTFLKESFRESIYLTIDTLLKEIISFIFNKKGTN